MSEKLEKENKELLRKLILEMRDNINYKMDITCLKSIIQRQTQYNFKRIFGNLYWKI
jgi:hypothetical protein